MNETAAGLYVMGENRCFTQMFKKRLRLERVYTQFAIERRKSKYIIENVNASGRALSLRRGNAQGFHLAVKMAALEAECRSRLRHVPAMLLQLAEDELPFIRTTRFVQC